MAHRTVRSIARQHGSKVPVVPAKPPAQCSVHGIVHAGGACNYAAPDAEADAIASQGGKDKAVARPSPFKLGGGR